MKKFQSIDIKFKNSRGLLLAARLELPPEPTCFTIFSPCFTCTKETLATFRISQLLAKKNIAVLRIDFTGLGESEGDFAESNFSTQVDDIVCANRFLSEHYQGASVLIGHSMGGTASFAAAREHANELETVKAVISIASPSAPVHVTHHFGEALDKINAGESAEFFVAGKPYSVTPQFLQHLDTHGLPASLHDLNKASLIFHADNDALVDIEQAYQLFEALPQPKSFVSLDTADHVLSNRRDNEYVANVIDSWLQRYIG